MPPRPRPARSRLLGASGRFALNLERGLRLVRHFSWLNRTKPSRKIPLYSLQAVEAIPATRDACMESELSRAMRIIEALRMTGRTLIASAALHSQCTVTKHLTVIVVDTSGASVSAAVKLNGDAERKTDEIGEMVLPCVQLGAYALLVKAPGFRIKNYDRLRVFRKANRSP